MTLETSLLVGLASTFGAGMLAQWIAWRFKLPAIVLLFISGLLLGPIFGVLHPTQALGVVLQPMVSLMVAIIVFEGAMALDFHQLTEAGEGVARLIALALPINWVLGTFAAHWVAGFSWSVATIFGAIVVVTGPTVVMPLLRQTRLEPRMAAFLRWEAIINDSLGAVLASLVLQLIISKADVNQHYFFLTSTLPHLAFASFGSAIIGFLPALAVKYVFNHDLMPERLKFPVLLVSAILIYQVCTMEIEGAGLVSVTVFGMSLANIGIIGLNELRRTKESLAIMIVSVLFIILTADLHKHVLKSLSLSLVILSLVMMFLVRPIGIFIATLRSGLTWKETIFAGWIAPRGIVAAALAGGISVRIMESGDPTASGLLPAVFLIIALTMTCHGFSFGPLARALHLSSSSPAGLAILGSSVWTDELAECIQRAGGGVLMVDYRLSDLQEVYKRGVPILRANLLSLHGQELLEERPISYLLAATPDPIRNSMVCSQLAPELGRLRVFQISPGSEKLDYYQGLSRDARGRILGEPGWSYSYFETLHDTGWRFYSRKVTKEEANEEKVKDPHVLDLFVLRKGALISIRSSEEGGMVTPSAGDTVIYFAESEIKVSEGGQTEVREEPEYSGP